MTEEERGRIERAEPLTYEATMRRLNKIEGLLEGVQGELEANNREYERLRDRERALIAEHDQLRRKWNFGDVDPSTVGRG